MIHSIKFLYSVSELEFNWQFFLFPSERFEPTSLVHSHTNSLSILTSHLAPSAKSTMLKHSFINCGDTLSPKVKLQPTLTLLGWMYIRLYKKKHTTVLLVSLGMPWGRYILWLSLAWDNYKSNLDVLSFTFIIWLFLVYVLLLTIQWCKGWYCWPWVW